MSIIKNRDTVSTNDEAAIAQLRSAFDLQRSAFLKDMSPSLEVRKERLYALAEMLVANHVQLAEALREDFKEHPVFCSDLIEIAAVAERAHLVADELGKWMTDEQRPADPELYGNARAYMHYQPKGVIGNMAPWNFPYDIGFGPVVEMLAAGNRVIIKPSDLSPVSSAAMAEVVAKHFDPDLLTTVVGGLELAKTFPTLPWDHLMYTGSPSVGKIIMRAAAENLVPVTLELGGKCPAVLTSTGVTSRNVQDILGFKGIKNGQMCVSVDYTFVPRDQVEEFVSLARQAPGVTEPGFNAGPEQTGIITEGHFDRLQAMLQESTEAGDRVVVLEEGAVADREERRIPLTLVIDPDPRTSIMQEEIFGPILPVVLYDDLDDVIARINAGERPLALSVYGTDADQNQKVLDNTVSGGASVNSTALHAALPLMGFGGAGNSGMGAHRGIEGFREFSNHRGLFFRGDGDDLISWFYPNPPEEARGIAEEMYKAFGGK